ncbi:hypothetical protein VAEU17_4360106 [Vibrio aestuarianus]|nr:hypothetical protein VAEU17_4360106 [Vibrio aestuarianus]
MSDKDKLDDHSIPIKFKWFYLTFFVNVSIGMEWLTETFLSFLMMRNH